MRESWILICDMLYVKHQKKYRINLRGHNTYTFPILLPPYRHTQALNWAELCQSEVNIVWQVLLCRNYSQRRSTISRAFVSQWSFHGNHCSGYFTHIPGIIKYLCLPFYCTLLCRLLLLCHFSFPHKQLDNSIRSELPFISTGGNDFSAIAVEWITDSAQARTKT